MTMRKEPRDLAGKIRLAAVDMDGTFLTDSKKFTSYSRRVLQELIDGGCLVVPATGRGFRGLTDDLLKLKGVRYVISADGAYVTDCITGKQIWKRMISCDTAAKLVDELLIEGNCVYYHRDDEEGSLIAACVSKSDYRKIFMRPGFPSPSEIITEQFGRFILEDRKNIPKIGLLFNRSDGFAHYGKLLSLKYPELNYFRSDDTLIEITSCHTDKGKALRELAKVLGISKEEILAIGDNGNDVSMLQYAGVGVAMANATKGVRDIADYVAGNNEEDGAARFLAEFLKLNLA